MCGFIPSPLRFSAASLVPFINTLNLPPSFSPRGRWTTELAIEHSSLFFSLFICNFESKVHLKYSKRLEKGKYILGRTFTTDGVKIWFSVFDTRFPPENSKSDRSSGIWSSCGLKEVGTPSMRKLFDSYFSSSSTSSTITSTSTDGPIITAASTSSDGHIQPTSTSTSSLNYVGLDFGDTVTVGACGIDPFGGMKNLVVKKSYLYQSLVNYRENLESMKTQAILDAENSIVKKKSINLNDYLQYIRSWSTASATLIPFYFKLKHRHLHHQRKKKKRVLCDKAVDRLLKLGGGSSKKKVENDDIPICFAVGMGDFKTVSGLPSLHTAFKGYFIKKVSIFIYFLLLSNIFLTFRSSVFYLFHDLLF